MDKEEQLFLNHLHDLADMCYQRDITTYTDFLNLNEQTVFLTHLSEFSYASPFLDGGLETAERKIVCFLPVYEEKREDKSYLPFVPLKISSTAGKFSVACSHRDYLGAILSLGIDRGKIGDLIVNDNSCYVMCMKNIADFLMQELTGVRHNPVSVSEVSFEEISGKQSFVPISGTVASERLDSILSVMLKTSRSKAIPYISSEKVFVNGKVCTSSSYVPNEGAVISVRGEGKFIYDGAVSETKKGRILVKMRKYN